MPRILIIEDDPDISEMTQKTLVRSLSAEVTVFSEGTKALRYLAESEPVDLIILDLSLPDISGFEVCHTLRASERTKGVPVVVLSAREGLDDKARADEVGVDAYLVKPVRGRVFLEEIKSLLQSGRPD